MRPLLLVVAVLASGCNKNLAELKAAQATLDARLVEYRDLADNLNERRLEVDVLELKVKDLEERLPNVAVPPVPAGRPTPSRPAAVIPPESPLEGREAAHRRVEIAETQRRIAELEKYVGEVDRLVERRQQLAAKLKALERLRDERNETSP